MGISKVFSSVKSKALAVGLTSSIALGAIDAHSNNTAQNADECKAFKDLPRYYPLDTTNMQRAVNLSQKWVECNPTGFSMALLYSKSTNQESFNASKARIDNVVDSVGSVKATFFYMKTDKETSKGAIYLRDGLLAFDDLDKLDDKIRSAAVSAQVEDKYFAANRMD